MHLCYCLRVAHFGIPYVPRVSGAVSVNEMREDPILGGVLCTSVDNELWIKVVLT